jgi:hypothetical protein
LFGWGAPCDNACSGFKTPFSRGGSNYLRTVGDEQVSKHFYECLKYVAIAEVQLDAYPISKLNLLNSGHVNRN